MKELQEEAIWDPRSPGADANTISLEYNVTLIWNNVAPSLIPLDEQVKSLRFNAVTANNSLR